MRNLTALSIVASSLVVVAACTSDDTSSETPDASTGASDAATASDDTTPDIDAAPSTEPSVEPDAATETETTIPIADAAPPGDAATDGSAPVDAATDAATSPEGDASSALDAAAPETDAATGTDILEPDAATETSVEIDSGTDSGTEPSPTTILDGSVPLDGAAFDAGLESAKTVLDLTDVKTNPEDYDWFDFRPNVQKLILAGAAETEHIAILWYTVIDGAVGLHYHAKTESVYVIDGTQTDAKGVYPTGTVYFNPPESGHAISDSSGFFVLAYAAPPDFASTDLIQEYEPVTIDTEDPDLMSEYPFEVQAEGISTYVVPLEEEGGLHSELIEVTTTDAVYEYVGNYVLVLEGECVIDDTLLGADSLVVTNGVEPVPFTVSSGEGGTCLALAISF